MNRLINVVLIVLIIVTITFEIGVTIGYYMLNNIDYNNFKSNYSISINK